MTAPFSADDIAAMWRYSDPILRDENDKKETVMIEDIAEELGIKKMYADQAEFLSKIRTFHGWLREDEHNNMIPKRADGKHWYWKKGSDLLHIRCLCWLKWHSGKPRVKVKNLSTRPLGPPRLGARKNADGTLRSGKNPKRVKKEDEYSGSSSDSSTLSSDSGTGSRRRKVPPARSTVRSAGKNGAAGNKKTTSRQPGIKAQRAAALRERERLARAEKEKENKEKAYKIKKIQLERERAQEQKVAQKRHVEQELAVAAYWHPQPGQALKVKNVQTPGFSATWRASYTKVNLTDLHDGIFQKQPLPQKLDSNLEPKLQASFQRQLAAEKQRQTASTGGVGGQGQQDQLEAAPALLGAPNLEQPRLFWDVANPQTRGAVGDLLVRYQIVNDLFGQHHDTNMKGTCVLGKGQFGNVYKAWRLCPEQPNGIPARYEWEQVALKVGRKIETPAPRDAGRNTVKPWSLRSKTDEEIMKFKELHRVLVESDARNAYAMVKQQCEIAMAQGEDCTKIEAKEIIRRIRSMKRTQDKDFILLMQEYFELDGHMFQVFPLCDGDLAQAQKRYSRIICHHGWKKTEDGKLGYTPKKVSLFGLKAGSRIPSEDFEGDEFGKTLNTNHAPEILQNEYVTTAGTLVDEHNNPILQGFPVHIGARYLRQLLAGLRFLKSKRIVHTDFKPENIMFGTGNRKQPTKHINYHWNKMIKRLAGGGNSSGSVVAGRPGGGQPGSGAVGHNMNPNNMMNPNIPLRAGVAGVGNNMNPNMNAQMAFKDPGVPGATSNPGAGGNAPATGTTNVPATGVVAATSTLVEGTSATNTANGVATTNAAEAAELMKKQNSITQYSGEFNFADKKCGQYYRVQNLHYPLDTLGIVGLRGKENEVLEEIQAEMRETSPTLYEQDQAEQVDDFFWNSELRIADFGECMEYDPDCANKTYGENKGHDRGIPKEVPEHRDNLQPMWYRAPEVLLGDWPLQPSMDMFSFGVVAWQIMTGMNPHGLKYNSVPNHRETHRIAMTTTTHLNDYDYEVRNHLLNPDYEVQKEPCLIQGGNPEYDAKVYPFSMKRFHMRAMLKLLGPVPPHVVDRSVKCFQRNFKNKHFNPKLAQELAQNSAAALEHERNNTFPQYPYIDVKKRHTAALAQDFFSTSTKAGKKYHPFKTPLHNNDGRTGQGFCLHLQEDVFRGKQLDLMLVRKKQLCVPLKLFFSVSSKVAALALAQPSTAMYNLKRDKDAQQNRGFGSNKPLHERFGYTPENCAKIHLSFNDFFREDSESDSEIDSNNQNSSYAGSNSAPARNASSMVSKSSHVNNGVGAVNNGAVGVGSNSKKGVNVGSGAGGGNPTGANGPKCSNAGVNGPNGSMNPQSDVDLQTASPVQELQLSPDDQEEFVPQVGELNMGDGLEAEREAEQEADDEPSPEAEDDSDSVADDSDSAADDSGSNSNEDEDNLRAGDGSGQDESGKDADGNVNMEELPSVPEGAPLPLNESMSDRASSTRVPDFTSLNTPSNAPSMAVNTPSMIPGMTPATVSAVNVGSNMTVPNFQPNSMPPPTLPPVGKSLPVQNGRPGDSSAAGITGDGNPSAADKKAENSAIQKAADKTIAERAAIKAAHLENLRTICKAKLSLEFTDLLFRCLDLDREVRITPDDALSHDFFYTCARIRQDPQFPYDLTPKPSPR